MRQSEHNSGEPRHDREDLKARIIDVAFAAFMRDGLRAVRMDDLSALLGISKRTLYECFADKEELLLACIRHHQACKRQLLSDYASGGKSAVEVLFRFFQEGAKTLENVNPRYFAELTKYKRVIAYLRERREREREDACRFYRQGVEQGVFRSDVNFEVYHALMSMMTDGFLYNEVELPYSVPDMMKVIVDVNLRGICTEKGLEMLKRLAAEN